MLAKLAIDPSVLWEENSSFDLEGLSRIWVERRLCVLRDLVDGKRNSYFCEAIKALPNSAVKTKWIDIYESAREKKLLLPVKLESAPEYPWKDTLVDKLISQNIVDVLILGRDRHYSGPSQLVDVISLDHVHHAKKILAAEKLRGGDLHPRNGDIELIWQENFQDEFKHTTNIYIVDQYMFNHGMSGFRKFLELAKRDSAKGRSSILNIYADSAGSNSAEQRANNSLTYSAVRERIEQARVQPHPFSEINLYMIPTYKFKGELGGRHIRFHDIFITTPDHGMELFELRRAVSINFNSGFKRYKEIEQQLENLASDWKRF